MRQPNGSVHPIHFEDLDGRDFERLVFAYHWRCDQWRTLEWYGQVGNDLGRDIWGVRGSGETVCIQCVNRKRLTLGKVTTDIAKVLKAPHGVPGRVRIVAQSNVSADMRDRIKAHAKSQGVPDTDIWSGTEFEERLRKDAEVLLKRFFKGEAFPDAPDDLKQLANYDQPSSDEEILALFARVFDRPAFYTPIHQESNLGDFKQAVTDTIQALGTGIWKARDGTIISRIPSRHDLKNPSLRTKVQAVEMALTELRAGYDDMIRSGALRRCQCNDPQCPVHFFNPPGGERELERLREKALRTFHEAYPGLHSSRPGGHR